MVFLVHVIRGQHTHFCRRQAAAMQPPLTRARGSDSRAAAERMKPGRAASGGNIRVHGLHEATYIVPLVTVTNSVKHKGKGYEYNYRHLALADRLVDRPGFPL